MPVEILMPALSPTMTEGNLAKWLKKEGDKIKPGDVIAEIETDKATMEVEAVDSGILGKIVIPEGTEGVAVNNLIALLLEDGEDRALLDKYSSKSLKTEKQLEKVVIESKMTQVTLTQKSVSNDRVMASPLAKRVAEQSGIDLSRVNGTGPHGRIIKADIEEMTAESGRGANPIIGRNSQEYKEIPNNHIRKVIAKRLLESKQTIPHFYLTIDLEIDHLLESRTKINDSAPKGKDGKPIYKISVNDFVIKAVAMALRDVPEANASWSDKAILQYNNIDISVAVAIDSGLITPVIFNADQKGLLQISNEMKNLALRARENKLRPEEFQGGGFSISNLGMYGIKNFQAIVNPPQSCILAVGSSEEKAVAKSGQIKVINSMSVTLSSDHRVVDGVLGARFLGAFKSYIEYPVTMFV